MSSSCNSLRHCFKTSQMFYVYSKTKKIEIKWLTQSRFDPDIKEETKYAQTKRFVWICCIQIHTFSDIFIKAHFSLNKKSVCL